MRDFASTSLFKSDLLLRCHDLPWQLATSTHSPATRIEEHRHTHYKETLFPSIAHALEANPTLFSFLFVKQPEELSTKAQYIYINTACYKAKPELYLWSMQALELKVSARGHAHWQPQQLGYNWLPAALFSPTIIKVRSPFFFFLPHGVSLYIREARRTTRWGSWGCWLLERNKIAVPSFCCFKPPLNFSHVPQGEEKSYQCYDLMAPLYVLTLPPMPV